MSTHNIFYDKNKKEIPKISLNIRFLSYGKNFLGAQNQVGISHGKRVIEVLLYLKNQSH